MNCAIARTDQMPPSQPLMKTFVKILVSVRKLIGAGPGSVDRFIGIEQLVGDRKTEQRPHEGLARGSGLETIILISPNVYKTTTTREDRTELMLLVNLTTKAGPTHIEAFQKF